MDRRKMEESFPEIGSLVKIYNSDETVGRAMILNWYFKTRNGIEDWYVFDVLYKETRFDFEFRLPYKLFEKFKLTEFDAAMGIFLSHRIQTEYNLRQLEQFQYAAAKI